MASVWQERPGAAAPVHDRVRLKVCHAGARFERRVGHRPCLVQYAKHNARHQVRVKEAGDARTRFARRAIQRKMQCETVAS